MMNLDTYNSRMVEEGRDNWLNPEYSFFGQQSTNVDYESETEEEIYEFVDSEIEEIKAEFEVEDLEELDKYVWAEILENLTGDVIYSKNIIKIDLESKTITYRK